MEDYFLKFREGIIGVDTKIPAPQGSHPLVYADWTASGRNYLPIESRIQNKIMPLVANTHTETSSTGMAMTHAYRFSRQIIKKHVNAGTDDLIITAGAGMTGLVNKLQRMLGLRCPEEYRPGIPENKKPVVFITHMEHHSNQTSWLETIGTVEIIQPTADGLVDMDHLNQLLDNYRNRPLKIASVTACSNVTGIQTDYHQIARVVHRAGGYCFVDFACSAPYVDINMHPSDAEAGLDAVIFSPHKFLGGPGASGVLIFNRKIYQHRVPDNPGGGTVDWTNPWGKHKYVDDIEAREDGGTPAFLQTIKAAMCISLKEEMGTANILAREHHLLNLIWEKLISIPNLHILADQCRERLPIISFYIDDLHYNLGVRLLNDKFGVQARGGCSCAGTYGHYLLHVDEEQSQKITDRINIGDYSLKPGWIRISLHPTMTDDEVRFIANSISELARNHQVWSRGYMLDTSCTGVTTRVENTDQTLKDQMEAALSQRFVKSTGAPLGVKVP